MFSHLHLCAPSLHTCVPPHSTSVCPLTPHLCPLFLRFTMVFSELPDMSDPSHDFAQQHQREVNCPEPSPFLSCDSCGLDTLAFSSHLFPFPTFPSPPPPPSPPPHSLMPSSLPPSFLSQSFVSLQDGRIGHHISRNGSNGVTAGGENHGGSGQKNSGRLGLGQHADGRRSYTSSPTGDYRPSPPHTHTSSQPSQQTHSLLVPTSHMHPTHSLLPPSVMGGPHGENHHSQNLGPHRTRQETGGTRYHPYSIRR